MIRRLVEELEKAQLEAQELHHEVREEKKKNKDFQNLVEEMVIYPFLQTNTRAQKRNNKKKVSIKNV